MSLVSGESSNINVSSSNTLSSNYGGVIGSSSSNVVVGTNNYSSNYGSDKVIEEYDFNELFNQGNGNSAEVQECINNIVNNLKYLGEEDRAQEFLDNILDANGNVDLDFARVFLDISDYGDLAYVVNQASNEKSYLNDVQKSIINILDNMKYHGEEDRIQEFLDNILDANGNVDLDFAKVFLDTNDYGDLAFAVEQSTITLPESFDVQNCLDKIVSNMKYLGEEDRVQEFLDNIYDANGNVDLDFAKVFLDTNDYGDLAFAVEQSKINIFYEYFEKQQINQIEDNIAGFDKTMSDLNVERDRLITLKNYFDSRLDELSKEELGMLMIAPYLGSDVAGSSDTHHYMTPEEYREYFEQFKYDTTFDTYIEYNEMFGTNIKSTAELTNENLEALFDAKVAKYEKQYCDLFYKINHIEYSQFVEDWNTVNSDIAILDASIYSLRQQEKEIPYIEMTWTEEYKKFMLNCPNLETVEKELDYYFLTSNLLKKSWDYLSDDDKYKYYYLIKTSSEEEAFIKGDEFLEAIQDKVNNAKGMEEATKFIESIGKNGLVDSELWTRYINGESLSDAEMTILKEQLNDEGFTNWMNSAWKTWWKGMDDGVDNFFEGIGNVFTTEGMKSANQYAQMYILGMIGDTLLGHEYQIATSVGNMVPAMAVSAVVGLFSKPIAFKVGSYFLTLSPAAVAGSTLMGLSSGGNAKNQALIEGHNLFSSTLYGAGVGLSETTLGLLLGNIPLLNTNASFALSEIMSEGIEEFLQTYVDGGLKAIILGEEVDFSQMGEEAIMAFMYGMITSAGMTGGQAVFNFAWNGVTVAASNLDSVMKFKSFCKENNVQVVKDDNGNNVLSVDSNVTLSSSKLKLLIEYFPEMKIVDENGNVIMEGIKTSVASSNADINTNTNVNNNAHVIEEQTNISEHVETITTQSNNNLNVESNTDSVNNQSQNSETNSSVDNSSSMDSYLDTQIFNANRYAAKGMTYAIDLDNFDGIPSDFWSKINDPSTTLFRVDGQTYTFLEAKGLAGADPIANLANDNVSNNQNVSSEEYYNNVVNEANRYAARGNFYSIQVENFSDIPSDFWSKINDPAQLFFVKDGKSISFAEAKALSEVDMSMENVQTELGKVDYGKNNPVTFAIEYLKSNMRKYLYKDTSSFTGLNEQIMENGLYHFTTAADAILESGVVEVASFNAKGLFGFIDKLSRSYVSPLSPTYKAFFFNGVPEVGAFATNLDSIPLKATAVKVDATSDLVNDPKLKVRYVDDQAITYDGRLDLNGYNAEKCFFVLSVEDGKLTYKQVSEEVYNNYESTNTGKALSEYISDKSNVAAIKNDFLAGISLRNTGGNVVDSGDVVSVMDDTINQVDNVSSLLSELENKVGRKALVLYSSTGNISHIPSEYRGMIENIALSDIKSYLNPDKSNIGIQFFGGTTNTNSQTVSDKTLKNDMWDIIKGHDAKHGQGDAVYRLNHVIDPNDSNYGRYEVISSNGNARSILSKYTPEQISYGLSLIGFNNVSNTSVSTNNKSNSSSNFNSVNNKSKIQNDIKNLMDLHNQIVGTRVNWTAVQGLMLFIDPNSRNYGRYEVISSNGGARTILQKYTPAQVAAILQSIGYDVGNVPVDNSIFSTNSNVSNNVNAVEYMSSISTGQINDNLNSVVSNFMNGRKKGNVSYDNAYSALIRTNVGTKRAPSTGRFEAFKNRFYNMTVESGGFNHTISKKGIEKNIEHRLYINADMDVTYDFLELFANKCEQRGIDYYFKTATNPYGKNLTRSESAVIYGSEEMITQYTQICQEIKAEHPEMSFNSPPVATSSIDGWLGYGAEPTSYTKQKLSTEGITGISFNKVRAVILDKAMDNSISSFVNKFGNSVISSGKTTNQLYIDSLYLSIVNSYKITNSNQQQELYNYLTQNSDYFLDCLSKGGSFMVGGYTANVKTTNAYMYDYVGNYSDYYTFMKQEIKNISYEYGIDPNNFAINLYN